MKLAGLFVILMAAVCGLGSCSLFDGKPKKRKPQVLGPSGLPTRGPILGGDSVDLSAQPDRTVRQP